MESIGGETFGLQSGHGDEGVFAPVQSEWTLPASYKQLKYVSRSCLVFVIWKLISVVDLS